MSEQMGMRTVTVDIDSGAKSGRLRIELFSFFAFCSVFVFGSIVLSDRFPFSAATPLASRVESCCVYEVFDAAGNRLDLERFGLQLGSPRDAAYSPLAGEGVDQRPHLSINRYGFIASRAVVVEQVGQRLVQHRGPRVVYVVQKVIGPTGDGRVGIIHANAWTVVNPRDEDVSSADSSLKQISG